MQPSFAHRRNRNGSYDSICTKCYATVASAESEEALSSLESAHVCDPFTLALIEQNSFLTPIPVSGLAAWSSNAGADGSRPTRYEKVPLQTKLRLTIKPHRAD
jgi:hypothetical protein